jgi:signal transduction histidine kinase
MAAGSILLVEDNADLADNLSEILESAGYVVRNAGRCADARAAAGNGFDVALVDVRLPDGDGIQLAAGLKALAPHSEVILLTGFATLESAIAAVRAGAWAYLVKPCAPSDLLIAIEQAVRHVGLQKEKEALTQRAHIAEKLAALGTMAAGFAHEIRNPLNAAHLQLKLAERGLGTGQATGITGALENLALVRTELERLNRIVEDALAFARPSGLVALPHDMAETVDTVARFLAPDAAAAGVALHVDGASTPIAASYDEGRIKQVLINLIRNAVDAAGPGGEVWASVRRVGETVELKVEDSGLGVPAGVDPFEPYFTTKDHGTGLGLPLAHRIVTEHGGALYLRRDAPRTAFVVELPLARPSPRAGATG